MKQLQIVQQQNGELLILSLNGQLDAMTADDLLAVIHNVQRTEIKFVVFDLKGVSLVDSSGIGAMVSLLKHTRSKEGDTVVAHLDHQPKEVFRVLNLNRAIKIFETVDHAVQELAPGASLSTSKTVVS